MKIRLTKRPASFSTPTGEGSDCHGIARRFPFMNSAVLIVMANPFRWGTDWQRLADDPVAQRWSFWRGLTALRSRNRSDTRTPTPPGGQQMEICTTPQSCTQWRPSQTPIDRHRLKGCILAPDAAARIAPGAVVVAVPRVSAPAG